MESVRIIFRCKLSTISFHVTRNFQDRSTLNDVVIIIVLVFRFAAQINMKIVF